MKRISKAKMLKRLAKLPEYASTREVMRALDISKSTIDRWLADPQFVKAKVAEKVGVWVWDRERLTAWVQAVMNLNENKKYTYKRSNPSRAMNPIEAAESLGIPKGYRVKRGDR